MDWFCAIRMAKIKLLQETFPERPLDRVIQVQYNLFVIIMEYKLVAWRNGLKGFHSIWIPS